MAVAISTGSCRASEGNMGVPEVWARGRDIQRLRRFAAQGYVAAPNAGRASCCVSSLQSAS